MKTVRILLFLNSDLPLLVLASEYSSIDSIFILTFAGYMLNYLQPLELFKSTNAVKLQMQYGSSHC